MRSEMANRHTQGRSSHGDTEVTYAGLKVRNSEAVQCQVERLQDLNSSCQRVPVALLVFSQRLDGVLNECQP